VEPYRYLMSVFLKEGVNELVFYSEQSFVHADALPNSIDTRRLTVYTERGDYARLKTLGLQALTLKREVGFYVMW